MVVESDVVIANDYPIWLLSLRLILLKRPIGSPKIALILRRLHQFDIGKVADQGSQFRSGPIVGAIFHHEKVRHVPTVQFRCALEKTFGGIRTFVVDRDNEYVGHGGWLVR